MQPPSTLFTPPWAKLPGIADGPGRSEFRRARFETIETWRDIGLKRTGSNLFLVGKETLMVFSSLAWCL